MFEIPIKDYEIYMVKEPSKEKKNEILDLFKNHNHLKSESEFEEIEYKLHHACEKGDLDHIKILLNETTQDSTEILTFKIDKTNHTASLFKVNKNLENLTIPRTVKYEMNDYLVTSITGLICSFDDQSELKIIKFTEDSSVSTIYGLAFENSTIEEIYFPKSLNELKEGWCYDTKNLKKIIISPSNGQFIFKDDQYLLRKSDIKNDEFDILLFARRDIEEISIPSNIKIIGSYSFEYSNTINIFIPTNVTKICENAFSYCSNLRKVEIPTNSNLQTIEKEAFSNSTIEEISIPPNLTKICENAFYYCSNLNKVEIPTNSNLQTIEKEAFSCSNIEKISIPSSLTKICENAFSGCSNLSKIEIPMNSNLQIFEDSAFSFSNIEEISIPSSLTTICECTFIDCFNLSKVEIPTNN